MANRFKESIKQRGNEILNIGKDDVKDPDEKPMEDQVDENKNEHANEETAFSLASILNVEKEKRYSNKTYYLEDKVIDEIKKISKAETKKAKANISESKIVNDILKHILNIK